jgi:hypothetical protein
MTTKRRVNVNPKAWKIPSASTLEEQERRDRLFMEAAPTVLAAIEIGWLPAGYAGPGIRLEYLRLLNGIEAGAWAKQAEVPIKDLYNWRSSRVMTDTFGEKSTLARIRLARLLAVLPQSGSLAWVLGGTGKHPAMASVEQRAKQALTILEGMRSSERAVLFQEDACKKLGIATFAVFQTSAKAADRLVAITTLAKHCAPWCSATWLRNGGAEPPAALRQLARSLRQRHALPRWIRYAREQVTLRLPRSLALELANVIDKDHTLDAAVRKKLLNALLSVADVPGLSFGGLTSTPLSVEEFLEMVPALRKGLLRHVQSLET